MGFICNHHKMKLREDKEYAKQMWANVITKARDLMVESKWNTAVHAYGGVFEIAQIMLRYDMENGGHERFIQSSVELAFVLKKSNYTCDIDGFLSLVRNKLTMKLPIEAEIDIRINRKDEILFDYNFPSSIYVGIHAIPKSKSFNANTPVTFH